MADTQPPGGWPWGKSKQGTNPEGSIAGSQSQIDKGTQEGDLQQLQPEADSEHTDQPPAKEAQSQVQSKASAFRGPGSIGGKSVKYEDDAPVSVKGPGSDKSFSRTGKAPSVSSNNAANNAEEEVESQAEGAQSQVEGTQDAVSSKKSDIPEPEDEGKDLSEPVEGIASNIGGKASSAGQQTGGAASEAQKSGSRSNSQSGSRFSNFVSGAKNIVPSFGGGSSKQKSQSGGADDQVPDSIKQIQSKIGSTGETLTLPGEQQGSDAKSSEQEYTPGETDEDEAVTATRPSGRRTTSNTQGETQSRAYTRDDDEGYEDDGEELRPEDSITQAADNNRLPTDGRQGTTTGKSRTRASFTALPTNISLSQLPTEVRRQIEEQGSLTHLPDGVSMSQLPTEVQDQLRAQDALTTLPEGIELSQLPTEVQDQLKTEGALTHLPDGVALTDLPPQLQQQFKEQQREKLSGIDLSALPTEVQEQLKTDGALTHLPEGVSLSDLPPQLQDQFKKQQQKKLERIDLSALPTEVQEQLKTDGALTHLPEGVELSDLPPELQEQFKRNQEKNAGKKDADGETVYTYQSGYPTATVDENDKGEIDYSILKGCKVNKLGNVVNDKGQAIGRITSGIMSHLIGRRCDENGIIWNDSGKEIGRAEPIPDNELQDLMESKPFESFEGNTIDAKGFVVWNGEKVGKVIEGDLKAVQGKTVDPDGEILDKAGNVIGKAERWSEEEPEPEEEAVVDRSILAGKRVNKAGNVVDPNGVIYGRVIDGNLKQMVGRMCNKNGEIVSESGDVIGHAELVSEGEREGSKEGIFGDLEGLTVNKEGHVVTPGGEIVGRLVTGDPKMLAGRSVDEDGDVLDRNGNVLGKAERWQPEEEVKEKGALAGLHVNNDGNVVDKNGNIIAKLTSGDPLVCAGKEIDDDGDVVNSKGMTVGHVNLLSEIPKEEVEELESEEEKAERLQREQDKKLATQMAACLEQCLDRIKPICKMITTKIEAMERKPEEERDEEQLVKEVRPLIEEGGNILREAHGVIRGLDPDGHIQANAKHKSGTREATPEEFHLAEVIKEVSFKKIHPRTPFPAPLLTFFPAHWQRHRVHRWRQAQARGHAARQEGAQPALGPAGRAALPDHRRRRPAADGRAGHRRPPAQRPGPGRHRRRPAGHPGPQPPARRARPRLRRRRPDGQEPEEEELSPVLPLHSLPLPPTPLHLSSSYYHPPPLGGGSMMCTLPSHMCFLRCYC